MTNLELNIDIEKTDDGFDIYLSDQCGGSGIEVSGATADEAIENLTPYLHDYLYRMEHPEEEDDDDDWEDDED
jgi:hypothetical protein